MGAFDGTRTHDWQASTDNKSDALLTAPRRSFVVYQKGQVFYQMTFSISMSFCLW